MTVFRWTEDPKVEELFVGCCDEQSVATIFKSNSGKHWRGHIELPIKNNLWKRWMPKDRLKPAIEKVIDQWLSFAVMDRPAQDNPEAE